MWSLNRIILDVENYGRNESSLLDEAFDSGMVLD